MANDREEQEIRGYLGYYHSFAGPAYSIVNKVIKYKNKKHFKYLYYLGNLSKIRFYHKARIKSVIHCDATVHRVVSLLTELRL